VSFTSETGAAVALRAQDDGARGVRDGRVFVAHPGWRGGPIASSTQQCAILAALERTIWPAVEGCLSKRTTYGLSSFFSSAAVCAFATFAVEKMIVEPK
jgi:hypothetical protein